MMFLLNIQIFTDNIKKLALIECDDSTFI